MPMNDRENVWLYEKERERERERERELCSAVATAVRLLGLGLYRTSGSRRYDNHERSEREGYNTLCIVKSKLTLKKKSVRNRTRDSPSVRIDWMGVRSDQGWGKRCVHGRGRVKKKRGVVAVIVGHIVYVMVGQDNFKPFFVRKIWS